MSDQAPPPEPATAGAEHPSSSAIIPPVITPTTPPIASTAGPIDPIPTLGAPLEPSAQIEDDEETIGATTPRGMGIGLPGQQVDQFDFGGSDSDSAYDGESLLGDDTRSLASYITHYRYENGRRYHSYRDGAYWVCRIMCSRKKLIV
jgi:hypothetical protein